jgi:predicted XRE-type DNA-binding protein
MEIPEMRKQKDSRRTKVTRGSKNVFADLGYANANEHKTKAKLVFQIAQVIKERGLTQAQTAARLEIDQPKVSAMLNGNFRGFSVYRLMHFVALLGRKVEIVTKDPAHPAKTDAIAVA